MTTKREGDEVPGKGRVRSLVRRGSKSDRGPVVARRTMMLRGTTMCERCGAVYRRKQWHRPTSAQLQWPAGLAWTTCPACRQVREGEYYGKVIIRGEAAERDEAAIRRRLEHIAERAQWTQPLRRIISVERHGRDLEVLTTSQKLAHRIVRSLVGAFGGAADYGWSESDGELRATWRWEGGAPQRAPSGKADAGKTPAGVRMEIQSRHADVDPVWRTLIERRAAQWGDRYPRLLSVHATLQHGRHRHGIERTTMVAKYPGHTLRVEKEGESMEDAIHSACIALERELRKVKEMPKTQPSRMFASR